MDGCMDNSGDAELWRRYTAADSASQASAGPCPDELTLASYLDGRLEARQAEAVEHHLADCGQCRRAAGELRELLAEPAGAMPPANFATRAAALVLATGVRPGLWKRAARWSAVAAAVAIVAWCGFAAGRKTYNDRRAAEVAVARQASFGAAVADDRGGEVVASVDAFDQMLLAGGDER